MKPDNRWKGNNVQKTWMLWQKFRKLGCYDKWNQRYWRSWILCIWRGTDAGIEICDTIMWLDEGYEGSANGCEWIMTSIFILSLLFVVVTATILFFFAVIIGVTSNFFSQSTLFETSLCKLKPWWSFGSNLECHN